MDLSSVVIWGFQQWWLFSVRFCNGRRGSRLLKESLQYLCGNAGWDFETANEAYWGCLHWRKILALHTFWGQDLDLDLWFVAYQRLWFLGLQELLCKKLFSNRYPFFSQGPEQESKKFPPFFYLYREMRKKITEVSFVLKDQRLTLKTKRVQD